MPHRLPLDVQMRRARSAIRVLHKVALYRSSRGKSVAWIADLIESQEQTIAILAFNLKHKATIRNAVKAKLDAIKDMQQDVRVQVVLDAFEGAELVDVREIES